MWTVNYGFEYIFSVMLTGNKHVRSWRGCISYLLPRLSSQRYLNGLGNLDGNKEIQPECLEWPQGLVRGQHLLVSFSCRCCEPIVLTMDPGRDKEIRIVLGLQINAHYTADILCLLLSLHSVMICAFSRYSYHLCAMWRVLKEKKFAMVWILFYSWLLLNGSFFCLPVLKIHLPQPNVPLLSFD